MTNLNKKVVKAPAKKAPVKRAAKKAPVKRAAKKAPVKRAAKKAPVKSGFKAPSKVVLERYSASGYIRYSELKGAAYIKILDAKPRPVFYGKLLELIRAGYDTNIAIAEYGKSGKALPKSGAPFLPRAGKNKEVDAGGKSLLNFLDGYLSDLVSTLKKTDGIIGKVRILKVIDADGKPVI